MPLTWTYHAPDDHRFAPELEINQDEADATALGIKGTPYWIILRPGRPTEWVLGSAITTVLAALRR